MTAATASDLRLSVHSSIKCLDLLDRVSIRVCDAPEVGAVYVTITKFDASGRVHFDAYCVATANGWTCKVENVASGQTFPATLDEVLTHAQLN